MKKKHLFKTLSMILTFVLTVSSVNMNVHATDLASVSGNEVVPTEHIHTYNYEEIDEVTHKVICEDCDYYEVNDHNFENDGICIECGYEKEKYSESIVETGNCGKDLVWTFYDNGLLRISGTGDMDSYDLITDIPWYWYEDRITNLEICDGVTSISKYAFGNCKLLTGDLVIPDSVKTLGPACFSDTSYTSVYLPDGLTAMGSHVFSFCPNLKEVYIPKSVKSIKGYIFTGCYNLKDVYYDGTFSEWSALNNLESGDIFGNATDAAVHIEGCNIVRFDSGEGSKIRTQTVENGQLIAKPENPTREYYNFKGWFTSLTNQTDETKWDFSTDTVSGDLILYAGWENIEVIVYLDANGGMLDETSSRQVYGACYTNLPVPSRPGYSFDGWYTEEKWGIEILETSRVINHDSYTIYAHWKPLSYKVIYNPTGGKVSCDYKFVKNNSTYGEMEDAQKPGYQFLGWFTDETDGTQILSSSIVNLVEDQVLYAHWKGNTYSVTFNARGGQVAPDTISVTNDLEYGELPVPTKSNCTFEGWYTDAVNGVQIKADTRVFMTSDTVLYAHWKGDARTVHFNANGGEVDTASATVFYDTEYGPLPVPIKTGYTFAGWFTDAEGGEEITEESIVKQKSDLTLYARWKINEYTVILHANGGSFGNSDVATYTVEYGNIITPYKAPVLYCHSISKWLDASGQEYSINDPIVSNLELYAQWEKKYTVENPVADIEAGQIAAGTGITLSTATNGAKIYYTLDGSMPTTESYLYDDAIIIDTDTTIHAVAVKDNYNSSDIVSFVYIVEDESDNWGDITDEDKVELEKMDITSASQVPNSFWIAGIHDQEYTGKAITFDDLHVYYHKTLLKLNSDYSIKYANNVNASSSADKKAPSVTITGKGNYTGTITRTFSIHKLDLGDGTTNSSRLTALNITLENTGKVQKGTTIVTYDINGNAVTLKSGRDFTYSYPDTSVGAYKNTGEYTVILTGKGNFTGTAAFKETITTDKKLISRMTFTRIGDQICTGTAIEPGIVIKDGSYVLQAGTDYTLLYQNNVNAGTANIIVTGTGNYSGTKMVTFKITAIAMKKVSVSGILSKEYTGDEILQTGYTLTYKADENTPAEILTEGIDYTVSYQNNIKVSKNKAIAVFTGKGRFSGTLKVKFTINTHSIQDADVTPYDIGTVSYQKNGTKPNITVTADSVVLKEGIDYTVKYSNNKDLNDGSNSGKIPSVTIKGKGNYSGTVTRTFKITSGSLSSAAITAKDIVYQNKAGICRPSVVITDSNGVNLTAGTDYLKTFTYTYTKDVIVKRISEKGIPEEVIIQEGASVDSRDIIPVGAEIKITATGINKYAGTTLSTVFRYVEADLSKAVVKVSDQVFTGNDIEPGKDQITVKLNKTTLKNTDYEIIGYSNNKDKGTATIILHGIGNYSGIKNATFKITNHAMCYTVVFDANGGKGNMRQMNISADSADLTANTIKRTGAVFKGWNTKRDGSGISYSDKQTVYSANNLGNVLKLYAQWEITDYSITYVLNGGINSESNPFEYNIESGTVNLNNATKEHSSFAGWYKDSNFKTKVTAIKAGSTGNLTLYAKWIPIKYNISFDANGGNGVVKSMTGLSYGTGYTLRKNSYTRNGYSFSEWNTRADGSGISYTDQASVMNLAELEGENVTLYAIWSINTYAISYVLNGGINNNDNPVSYTVSTDTILLKDPERDCYTFAGWYADSNLKNKVTAIPKGSFGNLKLYASWIPYQYNVIFNGNGNTAGNMADKTYNYGTSYTLPANSFKKSGYQFIGWNTQSDGAGTAYANKAGIRNLVEENNGTITLYAQWKLIPPVKITPSTGSITVSKGKTILATSGQYIYSFNLYKGGRLYDSGSWSSTKDVHTSFYISELPVGTYTLYVYSCSFTREAHYVYSEEQGMHYEYIYKPTYKNTSTYTCKITVK